MLGDRRTPAAAATSAAAVEMLKVPRAVAAGAAGVDEPSAACGIGMARRRIAAAAPAISAGVSPFIRSATSSAA